MYNSTMSIKVHNTYMFELVDASTGKVKQTAKAENVVCNAFYSDYSLAYRITSVRLGTGTGTPAATDTALFTHKYSLNGSQSAARYNDNTIRITVSATSPLGNTGSFTEVGLGRNSLLSHALITDAEGNPITVVQTDTDILNITAYVYMTLTFTDNTFTYPVRPAVLLLAAYNATNSSNYAIYLFTTSSVIVYLTDCVHTRTPNSVDSLSMNSGVSVDSANGASVRIGVNAGNTGYYNYIVIAVKYGYGGNSFMPVGFLAFPNTTSFPYYSATELPVGTGDGTTTQFSIPFDLFLAGSDTVYVNGVALTRNTDYTIDGNANSNKRTCISAGNLATASGGYTSSKTSSYSWPCSWFSTHKPTNPRVLYGASNPILFDFSNVADKRVNYISLPNARAMNTNWGFDDRGSSNVRIEYSDDGSAWTTAISTTYSSEVPQTSTITFETPIEANYWRLTEYSYDRRAGYDGLCALATGFLGYTKGYAIEFTTAPAADAVITMDCQLDRPYKSSNYVIDLSGSITMTNG